MNAPAPTPNEEARTTGGALILDGNRVRDEIVARLAAEISAAGSPPVCLATVLVAALSGLLTARAANGLTTLVRQRLGRR